ncbi:MAG: hypothetical protein PHE12_00885 [Clostridia bacterium]|nr:hypothetical protein [Clostridia bacterium]
MKQCKVCGTSVHIESNTCPSCGNHNFYVLDVKICPLCGKVNSRTSVYCEQCGKQFVGAQGQNYNAKKPVNVSARPPVYRERQQVIAPPPEKDYEIEKPVVKIAKPEETVAERAYKDFIALKPEIKESGDNTEFAYYVNGSAEKLPVVILPKFAKTQGKNILVNIVVNNVRSDAESDYSSKQGFSQIQPDIKKNIVEEDESDRTFKPFSSINGQDEYADSVKNQETAKESENTHTPENILQNNDQPTAEIIPTEKVKKLHKEKSIKIKGKRHLTFGSFTSSLFLVILSLGLIASFAMVFYNSTNAELRSSGISAVLYMLKDVFKLDVTLPPAFVENGFLAFWTEYQSGGQFYNYAHLIPYISSGIIVFTLINIFVLLFTFKHRRWAKIFLFITSLLSLLAIIVIALAIEFVYKASVVGTLGLGLIVAAIISLIIFITVIATYKPNKE